MIKIDPEFQTLIPPLSDDEYQRLEKSILAEGVRESIITWDGTIIDGHNRYRICQKYNINCPSKEREFESRDAARMFIIKNQLARRNLPIAAIGLLKLKEKEIVSRQANERQSEAGKQHGRGQKKLPPNLGEAINKHDGEVFQQLAKDIPLGRESLRKLDAIDQKAKEGNSVAIKELEQLMSGEKKSIHGAYVKVTGKEKPRKREETRTDDGRRLCVMCGEPINEGEAHAARPTVHKKCEQEYQRDWERDKRQRTSAARKAYLDAEKSLRENVAIYTVDSLYDELVSTAENLRDSWAQSIEINESMGVEISEQNKKLLKNAVDNLFKTAQQIKEDN